MTDLTLPVVGRPVSIREVTAWYANIPLEMLALRGNGSVSELLDAYYLNAGLLRAWRRPFFLEHYAETFARSAAFLAAGPDTAVAPICDLGAGLGTQALYLALKGFSVVAIDGDDEAITAMKIRQQFYEDLAGRPLSIEYKSAYVEQVDFKALGPIAGIYSVFAFNMMQPSGSVVDRVMRGLSPHARLAVLDGNRACLASRVFPSRRRDVWSPEDMSNELQERGFRIHWHRGAVVSPPLAWWLMPRPVLRTLEHPLRSSWLFPISHLVLAERCGAAIVGE